MYDIGVGLGRHTKIGSSTPSCTGQHTARTSTQTNGTSCINMAYLLFCEITCPLKHGCFTDQAYECGVYFFSIHPMTVPVHKIQFCCIICVVEFVNHSCLIWIQMQQFVGFLADHADSPVCRASGATNFLGNVCNAAPVSSNCPQHVQSAWSRTVSNGTCSFRTVASGNL